MKLTKEQLKKFIKEEMDNLLTEEEFPMNFKGTGVYILQVGEGGDISLSTSAEYGAYEYDSKKYKVQIKVLETYKPFED
jgi:hypothetical protein